MGENPYIRRMNGKIFPKDITSYDLLKTFALMLMIADHLGYFFYPDNDWLRAIGRLSAPIWLFLVGYANSRDFSPRMWIGIVILTVSAVAVGREAFPLTILATILVCRALIDPLMQVMRRYPEALLPFFAILLCLEPLVAPYIEYGAYAMAVVIFGYAARHRGEEPYLEARFFTIALLASVFFGLLQVYFYFGNAFDTVHKAAAMAGMVCLAWGLSNFRPMTFPRLTAALPGFLTRLVQLFGRRTLEIYVAHIVLFRLIAHAWPLIR